MYCTQHPVVSNPVSNLRLKMQKYLTKHARKYQPLKLKFREPKYCNRESKSWLKIQRYLTNHAESESWLKVQKDLTKLKFRKVDSETLWWIEAQKTRYLFQKTKYLTKQDPPKNRVTSTDDHEGNLGFHQEES